MIKKRYLTLTLALSLIGMNKSYAACTQEQLDAFKLVEKEYKITYELNRSTKDYTVKLQENENNKYEYVFSENLVKDKILSVENNTTIIERVYPGEYTVYIRSKEELCNDNLKTITIKLPRYNIYSEDPLCDGIEEFYLCQETYEKEIDRETFESRINTYKKSKEQQNKQETSKDNEAKEKGLNELLTYIQNNPIQVIIVVIFIILVIITIIVTIKQSRKSRRLE